MSFNITDKQADLIRDAGAILLLAGGALLAWGFGRFDQIPNYQKLLLVLPVLVAKPMFAIDAYRNWESTTGRSRGTAITFLMAPPMVLAGAIIWYVVDPRAMA